LIMLVLMKVILQQVTWRLPLDASSNYQSCL
jgi:hypothetical protein